jgi:hypothetical protein
MNLGELLNPKKLVIINAGIDLGERFAMRAGGIYRGDPERNIVDVGRAIKNHGNEAFEAGKASRRQALLDHRNG